MKRLFFLVGFIGLFGSLAGCSTKEEQPDYTGKYMPSDAVAVFARIGAEQKEMKSATNHLIFYKSLRVFHFDDLGGGNKPCKHEDTLFCTTGGLPILLPRRTGNYRYKIGDDSIGVQLSAPNMDTLITHKSRSTCEISMMKLVVKQDNQKYEYIISRAHGIVSITWNTKEDTDSWYLVAGRLMDLESICKNM